MPSHALPSKRIKGGVARRYLLAWATCLVSFIALLTAVCAIPKELIRTSVEASAIQLESEGAYYSFDTNLPNYTLDNVTTAIVLDIATHTTGNPLVDAMRAGNTPSMDTDMRNPAEHFGDPGENAYARYWHGYLVLYIPLLILFDLVQIRWMLEAIAVLVLVAVSVLLAKKGKPLHGLVLAFALMMVEAPIAELNLSLGMPFLVGLVGAVLVLVQRHRTLLNRGTLFFLLGALTTYVDFLTTPLMALALPLLVALADEGSTEAESGSLIKVLLVSAVSWGLGYGLLWLSKWIVGSIILGSNVLLDAADTTLFRVGGGSSPWTLVERADVVLQNFRNVAPLRYLSLLGVPMLFALIGALRHNAPRPLGKTVSYAMVALLPVLWFMVVANHSGIHSWFTYRNAFATFCAVGFWCLDVVDWHAFGKRISA